MGNAVVAEGRFKLLTEIVEKVKYFKRWRVGCSGLGDNHYRQYQLCANMFIATAIAWICHRIELGIFWHVDLIDAGFVMLEATVFFTSRDTVRNYFLR